MLLMFHIPIPKDLKLLAKKLTMNIIDEKNSCQWINSNETKKILKISDCSLMHLRELGKFSFKKERNSFLYLKFEVENYIKQLAQPSSSASDKISSK